jgi:hypothetical protein
MALPIITSSKFKPFFWGSYLSGQMKITTFSSVGQLLEMAPNNQWSLGDSLRFITMVLETNQRTGFNQVSLKSKNRSQTTEGPVLFL